MSFTIITGLICLVTGIVLMFYLNYKLHLKVSGLESDFRIIRSQIKLNSETVKYDLALIDTKIKQLGSKITDLECVNITKEMNKVSEEFQRRRNKL